MTQPFGGDAMAYVGGRHSNGDPSRRLRPKLRVRGRVVLIALVSVVVGLAVVAASLHGRLIGGKTNNSPVGSVAARAQAAISVTKGSKWLDGSSARMLTAVNADIGKIGTARHARNDAAARAAGARLASDATAALAGAMPPVDAKLYRSALKDLKTAGSDDAHGEFSKAAPLLAKGRAAIMKVTAAADLPVKAKTPTVFEPNGQ